VELSKEELQRIISEAKDELQWVLPAQTESDTCYLMNEISYNLKLVNSNNNIVNITLSTTSVIAILACFSL